MGDPGDACPNFGLPYAYCDGGAGTVSAVYDMSPVGYGDWGCLIDVTEVGMPIRCRVRGHACAPACTPAADGNPPAVPCGCQNPDTDGNGLCGFQAGDYCVDNGVCDGLGGGGWNGDLLFTGFPGMYTEGCGGSCGQWDVMDGPWCDCASYGGSPQGWKCTHVGGCIGGANVYNLGDCYPDPGNPGGANWVLDGSCL